MSCLVTMGQALINRINTDTLWSPAPARAVGYRRPMDSCCWSRAVVILVVIASLMVTPGSGLSCVQCVSMDDSGCTNGGGVPKECTGAHANSAYCLKSVGTVVSGKGHFVMRSCSDKPIINCTRQYVFGDMYTVCHYPCAEFGCNAGSGLHLGGPTARSPSGCVARVIALSLWSVATTTIMAALFTLEWRNP